MTQKNKPVSLKSVVIGVSTGGVNALKVLLKGLNPGFTLPVIVVSHLFPDAESGLAELLDSCSQICVKEADEGDRFTPGVVYIAPPNYHLLVNTDLTASLSVDPPVNFARPSVDVLFESAAIEYGVGLIGVILTGAGSDGALGLKMVHDNGGVTIVENPETAEMEGMPLSAIKLCKPDYVVSLNDIAGLLEKIASFEVTK